ncbi:MAG: hypothetical protein N838_03820 [Thiohalocapsa sp. PB-PSB1]|nr:MAG: hypothetical protein N838_03820 [Thiohalocapsa sp. PB-PSB1]
MDTVLTPIFTDEGRRRLLEGIGSAKNFRITHVQVGSGDDNNGYVPTAEMTVLKARVQSANATGEVTQDGKRVHVAAVVGPPTAEEELDTPGVTQDVYEIYEIGFLVTDVTGGVANGEPVLFAIYAREPDEGPLLSKTPTTDLLLAFDLLLPDLPEDHTIDIAADTYFDFPLATETQPGVLCLATSQEVTDGSNGEKAITPATLRRAHSLASADGTNESAVIVDAAGKVGIGTSEPLRTELDTGTGVLSGAANDYIKAQFTLSGGGTVTWGGPGGRLKWTRRFIAISMERGASFSEGHVNIVQPTSDIPAANVYDGKDRAATSDDGVLLKDWEALYAVHRVGGSYDAVEFQIVRYHSDFYAPSNWILVAVVNKDDQTVKLGTGVTLGKNSSSTNGSPIPRGVIMMWHRAVDTIPDGWALCDGSNDTPNLSGRFIVGFKQGDSSYGTPGEKGGAETVNLSVNQIPPHSHTGSTSSSENHRHWIEGTDAPGLSFGYRTIEEDTTVDMAWGGGDNADPKDRRRRGKVNTDYQGAHKHSLSIDNTGGGQPHENRPPYYALCYIMKL